MTYHDRIAELTAEWEEGANYGEAEPTHRAADYMLSEDDWAAYLGTEGAAEIVALIQQREDDREKAEQIAAAQHAELMARLESAGVEVTTDLDSITRATLTAAALTALTDKETAQ